jgi:hypothetical protein
MLEVRLTGSKTHNEDFVKMGILIFPVTADIDPRQLDVRWTC